MMIGGGMSCTSVLLPNTLLLGLLAFGVTYEVVCDYVGMGRADPFRCVLETCDK